MLYSAVISRITFPSIYFSAFLYWLFSRVRAASSLSSYVLLLLFSDSDSLIANRLPPMVELMTLMDGDNFGSTNSPFILADFVGFISTFGAAFGAMAGFVDFILTFSAGVF